MKTGIRYQVGMLIIFSIGIVAGLAFAGSCDVSLQAEGPAVVKVDCPTGYQNCYGEPLYDELVEELNWCNTAWSGRPVRLNPEGIERVMEWRENGDLTMNFDWVFRGYDETPEQRELRIALGGWVSCKDMPRD